MNIKKMISYRSIWMGFAMLLVMLFHSRMFFSLAPLNAIKETGYGGVDIFIFAAGIGNYFSYLKDEAPLDFIKRRICRLAPSYIPFILIWCSYCVYKDRFGPRYIIGHVFGVQEFAKKGGSFNWYLGAIVICYILTPYLASFIKKSTFKKNIIFLIILLLLTTGFWKDTKFIVSIARLPIFTIGMIFAKYSDAEIKFKHVAIELISFIVGIILLYLSFTRMPDYLWSHGLYWYPFILIVPFLCYILSVFGALAEKNKPLTFIANGFKKIGETSFEIFLIHIFFFERIKDFLDDNNIMSTNLLWLGIIIAAVIIALIYKWIITKLFSLIQCHDTRVKRS